MNHSQPTHRSLLVAELAVYLDSEFSDYPVIHLSGDGLSLTASYARVDVVVDIRNDCAGVLRADAGVPVYVAPSMASAIEFLASTEAVRQCKELPFLQFHTGNRPSSAGNSACM